MKNTLKISDAERILNGIADVHKLKLSVADIQILAAQVATMHNQKLKACEGFQYIGQHLSSCDNCGLPYWDHEHLQVLKHNVTSIFNINDDMWDYFPISQEAKDQVRRAYLGA